MGLKDAMHMEKPRRRDMNYLEGAIAMVASEAGLVVNPVIGGQLVDQIHCLFAGFALLGCSCECHVFECLDTTLR